MENSQLDFFKKDLLKRRQELLEDANKTLNDGLHVRKEELPDTVDRSSSESDRNFMLKLRERERKLIKKIDEALQRIENNTFGICEKCEEEIGEKRLVVRPVATLCIECKEEQEREEKLSV
ncbi:MAG: RNA polymerase-binding protein DksA [Nitrospinota bacterium]